MYKKRRYKIVYNLSFLKYRIEDKDMRKKLNYLLLISIITVMSLTLTFASDHDAIQGADVRASLLSGGEQEIFVIDPITSGTYTIETRGQVDTYGILYNSKNEIVAEGDDGNDYDNNFKLSAALSVYETYYLHVSGYAYEDTGFYTVVVTKEGLKENPLTTGVKHAKNIYSSAPITSEISRGSEVYFSFIAPLDDVYTFASSGALDTFGVLLDDEGQVIASDDDSYDGLNNFSISAQLEKGKTYIVGVGGYSYYTEGMFEIEAQRGYTSDFDDDDDSASWYQDETSISFETAADLDINTATSIAISEGNVETFRFSPDSDGEYTVMSTGDVDTYGTLYDVDTAYLTSSDDATYEDLNFRIESFLEAGKTYYLTVEGYGYDDEGTADVIWLKTEDAPVATDEEETSDVDQAVYQEWLDSAVSLKLDVPQTGSFDTDSENLFEFIPEETGMYTMTSLGGLDTYAMLYTEDAYIAMSDDISDDDYNFELEAELEANTTYYLYVSYYTSDTTGSYDVVVKQASGGN